MKKIKKILIITGIVILVLALSSGAFALFANYSKGTRAGTVVKFSKKGYVFKTYEGQLNVGGITTNEDGGVVPSVWEFTVKRGNDKVQEALGDAMIKGDKVKLHYKEKYFQYDWRGDTKYFVYKVERVRD